MWNKYTLIVGEIHFLGSILQILTKFTIFCICKDKIAKKKKTKKKTVRNPISPQICKFFIKSVEMVSYTFSDNFRILKKYYLI